MKLKELVKSYKDSVCALPGIETIFLNSGLVNRYAILDFGFFPLGSGIFKREMSKIDEAEIDKCDVMVLGNDFGTQEYIDKKCTGNKESLTNPTIRNLLKGLELNEDNTFFTNLFLGLRRGGTNTKRAAKIKDDYKDVCFNFFKVQLEFINPKVVLCLGKDVGDTLSAFPAFGQFKTGIAKMFGENNKRDYIVTTDDDFFGQRKFILIPHPSFAHINWSKNNTKQKIMDALLSE